MVARRQPQLFAEVSNKPDFPALERASWGAGGTRAWWSDTCSATSTPSASRSSTGRSRRTPMGVHHAWGRTYKDLFQRFHTMLGERAALPERLRLPGPVGRGRGREGAGLQDQARHRDLRHRRVRGEVQGARAADSPPCRPSSRSAWATGWTGTTPTTRCPTRTTTPSGASSRRATSAAGSTRATT